MLEELMHSAQALSTQENLWLLLAFDVMHRAQQYPSLKASGKAKGFAFSKNKASARGGGIPIGKAAAIENPPFKNAAAWLMRAEFRVEDVDVKRTDRGLRIERVLFNLTDQRRTGGPDAPLKLGDKILVTYRLFSRKLHHYVAIEDLLPAGLETINPDLAAIGRFYELPSEAEGSFMDLSHSELRDDSTRLYFNRVDPGETAYSVLARATGVGSFRWPQTQAAPMYDSRFSGLSESSICVVKE
jgi:uncharacterized protein YfaS (alpha-2-macroglobulin family)